MHFFSSFHRWPKKFKDGYSGKGDSSSSAGLFLNARFVEVNFHWQRPCFLDLLWLFHGDGDHRAQVVWVDFVGIVQKLFISIDTQLSFDVLLWRSDEAGTAEPQHDHDGKKETSG